MGLPKQPKQEKMSAAPRESALDVQKALLESEADLRRRKGFRATAGGGEMGYGASVLG